MFKRTEKRKHIEEERKPSNTRKNEKDSGQVKWWPKNRVWCHILHQRKRLFEETWRKNTNFIILLCER